jgi:hypothetical protein
MNGTYYVLANPLIYGTIYCDEDCLDTTVSLGSKVVVYRVPGIFKKSSIRSGDRSICLRNTFSLKNEGNEATHCRYLLELFDGVSSEEVQAGGYAIIRCI